MPNEETYVFRMPEKKSGLKPKDAALHRTLEGLVCQRVLRIPADRIFRRAGWFDLAISLSGFPQILFRKREKTLESSTLVAYSMYKLLRNDRKEYETTLIQNVHRLVALNLSESRKVKLLWTEVLQVSEIAMWVLYVPNIAGQKLDTGDVSCKRKRKDDVYIFRRLMLMILDDLNEDKQYK